MTETEVGANVMMMMKRQGGRVAEWHGSMGAWEHGSMDHNNLLQNYLPTLPSTLLVLS